ncbi:Nacht and tpr domain protein [Ceratocystis lukuohia]|uniref:Nacht and tpr domain protein n=1 Tax=Ceratocystis lukuohia TaxID=2019550 RepID=A0ABR4MQ71_9PEZI
MKPTPLLSEGPEVREDMEKLFQSLIAEAHNKYIQTAEKGKSVSFLDPSMRSISDLVVAIDRQNDKFQAFREQKRGIIDVVTTILQPVDQLGQAFGGLAEQAFAPSLAIFTAVRLIVGAADGVSQTYDAIVDMFQRLQSFTTRLHFYSREEMSPQLRAKCVEIMAVLFEVMLVALTEINRGRVNAYLRRLVGKGSPVQAIIDKLDNVVEDEAGLVMAETLAEIKRTIAVQQHIEAELQKLNDDSRDRSMLSNRIKIKEIIHPSVYSEDRFRYLEKSRTPGTGDWLVQDSSFQAWFKGETQILWLSGSPGTGKSYIAARVISWINEQLFKLEESSMDSLAYFFFRDNRPETRSVHQAIRDISHQLAEDDDLYSKTLLYNILSEDDIKTIPSAFTQLLKQPILDDTRKRTVYLILDGIDEAEPSELKILLGMLQDMASLPIGSMGNPVSFQVMITGRPTLQDMVAVLGEADGVGLSHIVITTERSSGDVKMFINEEVKRLRILKRTEESTKQKIAGLLNDKVGGLFILAQFMLADINNSTHMSSIFESVQRYPQKAEDMLRQTISRLQDSLNAAQINDLNEILIWVTCAQETLKLSEIIAIFELRFGAPPLTLEETLRGPYSCFFALIREDGLTTADLVKQLEGNNSTKSPVPPPDTTKISIEDRNASYNFDYIAQPNFQFDSNTRKTNLAFFHASITEFFRTGCVPQATADGKPGIGFHLTEASLHILKTCLQVLVTPKTVAVPEKKTKVIIGANLWRYASWYWQEHLVAVNRGQVNASDKQEIGCCLYKLLTERDVVLGWTQEEESLKLFTDANMACITEWMSDPEVTCGLPPEAQAWTRQVVKEPGGLVEKIGRLYASAWLDPSFDKYVSTLLCLQIVHSVAYIQEGQSWTDLDIDWSHISPHDRIQKALDWAKDIKKSGHWYRRVGSTYVSFKLAREAENFYKTAIIMDGNMVDTVGRMGYCRFIEKDYDKALIFSLSCEVLEESSGKNYFPVVRSQDASYRVWRRYSNQLQIADCYRHLKRIDQALQYYKKAINNSYNRQGFEPEAAYLSALGKNNKHAHIMVLIKWMNRHSGLDKIVTWTRLQDFLVAQAALGTLSEWTIPRAACISGDVAFMANAFHKAIRLAIKQQDPAKELYLRLALGMLRYYSREYEKAISIHVDILGIGSHLRGSLLVRRMHLMSLRSLALVYKQLAVSEACDPTSLQTSQWVRELDDLQGHLRRHQHKDMPQRLVGLDVNDAVLFRGLLYRLAGQMDEAKRLIASIIDESLAILEDDEPANDPYALDNIARALVAIGDTENARALYQSMRKPASERLEMAMVADSVNASMASVTATTRPVAGSKTPIKTNPLTRPLLPYSCITPRVCAQCLNIIGHDPDLAVCTHCLDIYCVDCLETIIKPNNRLRALEKVVGRGSKKLRLELIGDDIGHKHTEGQMSLQASRVIVCGPDHEWFLVPAMTTKLRRGEIILADGRVESIELWKEKLRQEYLVSEVAQKDNGEDTEEEEEGEEEEEEKAEEIIPLL